MTTLRFVASAILALAPLPCSAAGWSDELTILSLNTESVSDVVYFYVSPAVTYTTGCDPNSWMVLPTTEARQQRVYSTLLTAMTAGKKIRLWFTDTCANWSYHNATAIKIID